MKNVDEQLLHIVVDGKPEPQGSAQAFVPQHPKTKQPYRRADGSIIVNVTSDNKALKAWRERVAAEARKHWQHAPLRDTALVVVLRAYLYRPQNHWGTGANAHLLKENAPAFPLTRPDVDKLLRASLDSLTGVVWADDNLVVKATTEEFYAVPEHHAEEQRAEIFVYRHAVQRASDLPMDQRVRRAVPVAAPEDDGLQTSFAEAV